MGHCADIDATPANSAADIDATPVDSATVTDATRVDSAAVIDATRVDSVAVPAGATGLYLHTYSRPLTGHWRWRLADALRRTDF
jgi:hypothetical protein